MVSEAVCLVFGGETKEEEKEKKRYFVHIQEPLLCTRKHRSSERSSPLLCLYVHSSELFQLLASPGKVTLSYHIAWNQGTRPWTVSQSQEG